MCCFAATSVAGACSIGRHAELLSGLSRVRLTWSWMVIWPEVYRRSSLSDLAPYDSWSRAIGARKRDRYFSKTTSRSHPIDGKAVRDRGYWTDRLRVAEPAAQYWPIGMSISCFGPGRRAILAGDRRYLFTCQCAACRRAGLASHAKNWLRQRAHNSPINSHPLSGISLDVRVVRPPRRRATHRNRQGWPVGFMAILAALRWSGRNTRSRRLRNGAQDERSHRAITDSGDSCQALAGPRLSGRHRRLRIGDAFPLLSSPDHHF